MTTACCFGTLKPRWRAHYISDEILHAQSWIKYVLTLTKKILETRSLWLTWQFGKSRFKRRLDTGQATSYWPLARYVKLRVVHALEKPGMFSSPPQISDPDMHHGTCVRHVPWCMPGSLTIGFRWSRRRGKRSRHSRRMRKPQFCVSGKRPIIWTYGGLNYYIYMSLFPPAGMSIQNNTNI